MIGLIPRPSPSLRLAHPANVFPSSHERPSDRVTEPRANRTIAPPPGSLPLFACKPHTSRRSDRLASVQYTTRHLTSMATRAAGAAAPHALSRARRGLSSFPPAHLAASVLYHVRPPTRSRLGSNSITRIGEVSEASSNPRANLLASVVGRRSEPGRSKNDSSWLVDSCHSANHYKAQSPYSASYSS